MKSTLSFNCTSNCLLAQKVRDVWNRPNDDVNVVPVSESVVEKPGHWKQGGFGDPADLGPNSDFPASASPWIRMFLNISEPPFSCLCHSCIHS